MAKCKFCGKPVKVTPVYHKDCFEGKFDELAAKICEKYCKFYEVYENKDFDTLLDEYCAECPLSDIEKLGV